MLHIDGLKGLIIFLVVAGVIVPLFHRARIGTVLGFLIAGVVLGPHGLGRLGTDYQWLTYITFDDPERGAPLAEFGIIVLLFLLGLELSLQRLWQLRRYVLGVGVAQMALTTLAIGTLVRVMGGAPPTGVVLGLGLALSSTAVVMQLLLEQHRAGHIVGRIALSVVLFQDLMVVPILVVVGLIKDGGAGGILPLVHPFAGALTAVVTTMLLGRFVVGPLLRSAVRTGSRDLIMAITLLIVVAFSMATALAGLSVALGAFLAGILLSGSEARHHIEIDLEPFKGLLLGIFFITVGTNVDPAVIVSDIGWIAAALVAMIACKALILYVVARAFGIARAVASEVALLLAQAGEFAFVVIGVAQVGNLLSQRVAAGAVAVVGLSMVATPLIAFAGRRLGTYLGSAEHLKHGPGPETAGFDNHVIIGGFGRVGRLIAQALEAESVPYIALDTHGAMVSRERRGRQTVYYGDAGRTELLKRVGGVKARAFVVTVNNARAAERMVEAARKINPDALVFARAADTRHAIRLADLGAVAVVPETVEASLQLAGRVLEELDFPEGVVSDRISAIRSAELERITNGGGAEDD